MERATLSTCGGRTTEDKVGDGKAAIADLREHEYVRTRWSGKSSEEARVIEAWATEEGVTTDNDVQMEVATERWCRDLTHTGSRDSGGRLET